MRARLAVIAAILLVLGLSACGSSSHHHKKQYGRLYKSSSGAYYTRTYNSSGELWFWLYIISIQNNSSGLNSSGNLSGGSWQQSSRAAPSDLTETSKDVKVEENGEPTEDTAEADAVPVDETVTEDTTPNEAQSDSQAEASNESNNEGSNEGGSEGGGESGGGNDGGGDGGGGDGGGGGGGE